MKTNLAVMFGGVSPEHDISIITAIQVMANIDTNKYNIVPIYIAKDGQWLSGQELQKLEFFKGNDSKKLKNVAILPNNNWLYKTHKNKASKLFPIDVALMAFHGAHGEDGSIAALLEMAGIPYTSANTTAAQIAQDKCAFKYYVAGLGLNTAKFLTFNECDYRDNETTVINKVAKELKLPVIIKPSKLGSSIGISVCNNKKELESALELAFSLGEQVLVEQYLQDITEINCAVLGRPENMIVSELEEPIKTSEILSFENKYIHKHKSGSGGMASLNRKMPPNISQELYQEVVNTSKLLFRKLNLKGVIRIDYIVKEGKLFVNEVNTIPGSMANYLFKPKGINFTKLIDALAATAISDNIAKQQKTKTFNSDVLKHVISGSKTKK